MQLRPIDRPQIGYHPVCRTTPDGVDMAMIRIATHSVTGIIPDVLVSNRRFRWLVRARKAAALVAHDRLNFSLPVIASALGHRDHTTVLHAVVEGRDDADIISTADAIERRLELMVAA